MREAFLNESEIAMIKLVINGLQQRIDSNKHLLSVTREANQTQALGEPSPFIETIKESLYLLATNTSSKAKPKWQLQMEEILEEGKSREEVVVADPEAKDNEAAVVLASHINKLAIVKNNVSMQINGNQTVAVMLHRGLEFQFL